MTRPPAIGLSSTAVIGTATGLGMRGMECREAKRSDMQEVVAPESIKANVEIGFLLGKRSTTLIKKWSGELRYVLVEKMNVGVASVLKDIESLPVV